MSKFFREESRREFCFKNEFVTDDEIKVGCLQRIADATEKMASSYDSMREKAERYERYFEEERTCRCRRDRQIAALRGQITKLRKKLDGATT